MSSVLGKILDELADEAALEREIKAEGDKSSVTREFLAGAYSTYSDALDYAAEVTGSDTLDRKAKYQAYAAGLEKQRSTLPQSLKEVRGIADLGGYAAGLAAGSAPQIGLMFAGGGVGAGVRGGLALATGKSMFSTARAVNAAKTVGAAAATQPSFAGSLLKAQDEAGRDRDLLEATALSVPGAALNVIGMERAILGKAIGRENTFAKAAGSVAGAAGATAVKVGSVEAAAETAQQFLTQVAKRDISSEEAIDAYTESLVAGGLLGGPVGGVRGAIGQYRVNKAEQRKAEELLAKFKQDVAELDESMKARNEAAMKQYERAKSRPPIPTIATEATLGTPDPNRLLLTDARSGESPEVINLARKNAAKLEAEAKAPESPELVAQMKDRAEAIKAERLQEKLMKPDPELLLREAAGSIGMKSPRGLSKVKGLAFQISAAMQAKAFNPDTARAEVAKAVASAKENLVGAPSTKAYEQRAKAIEALNKIANDIIDMRSEPKAEPVPVTEAEPVVEPKAAPPETIALPPEPTAKPLTREQQQGMGRLSQREMMSESERNTIRDLSDNISPAVLTVLDASAENKFLSAPVRKAEIELKRPLTQEEKDYVEYAVILRQANEKREAAEAKDIERANKVQANLKEQDTTLGVPEKKPKPQPKAAQEEAPAAVVPAAPAAKPKAAAPADVSRRAEQAKATEAKKQTVAAKLREQAKAKKKAAQEAALAPKLEQTVANKAAKLDRIRKESADFARAREQVEADRKANPPKRVETIPLPKGMVEGEKSRLPIAASEKQGPGKTANQKTKERRERRQRKAQMEGVAPQTTVAERLRNRGGAAENENKTDAQLLREDRGRRALDKLRKSGREADEMRVANAAVQFAKKQDPNVAKQIYKLLEDGKIDIAADFVQKMSKVKDEPGASGKIRTKAYKSRAEDIPFAPEDKPSPRQLYNYLMDNFVAGFKAAPILEVYNSTNAPDWVKAEAARSNLTAADGTIMADAMHVPPKSGRKSTVIIFADRMKSLGEAKLATFHEMMGHYGLRRAYHKRMYEILRGMYDTNPEFRLFTEQVRTSMREADARYAKLEPGTVAFDKYVKENTFGGLEPAKENLYMMEEAYVLLSEGGKVKSGLVDRFISWMRDIGRRMGKDIAWTERDIYNSIRYSQQSVYQGFGKEPTYKEMLRITQTARMVEEIRIEDGARLKGTAKTEQQLIDEAWSSGRIGDNVPGAVGEAIRRRAEVHAKLGTDAAAKNLMATVRAFSKNALLGSMFTRQLFDYIKRKNLLKGIDAYEAAVREKEVINRKWSEDAARIAEYAEALGNAKSAPVMDMLRTHTIEQTWAYQPKGLDEKVDINPEAQRAYNKLDNKQKHLYHSIIEHGISTKKEIVGELIKQIEGLRDSRLILAKDDKAKERIREQAKNDMDRLRDEFKQLKGPYVPLARFGNYVLVGRSAEFKKLEQDIQKMEESTDITADTRTELNKLRSKREAMRADPKHYFMSMHENAGKAAEAKQLLEQDKGLSNLTFEDAFEREGAFARGHGPRWADLESIKARVSQLTSGNPNDADATAQQSEIAQRINQVLTDLYLESLAEASARRHNLPRAGVSGASNDVMRGFLRKAKSDAGFISTMKTNDKLVTSMNELRKSTTADATGVDGTRDDRKKAYNEILKRHYQSMEYVETPVQDKVMAVSSFWMLLSAPRYFIMNLSQAPLVSVPYMAGRYGLSNSYKAWWDAAGLVYKAMAKDWAATRSGQFNIKDMGVNPKEEAFLQTLQDQGLLDIGINSELGAWDVSSDNVISNSAKGAMQKLQNVARQVEVMNRAASGLAAFRMAEAAGKNGTAYGIEVVNRTHFDYTKNNAPSLYNKLPKVMTQFRKYQIGQIAMFGGLLREAFTDADPKERAVAKKILLHTMGNTALITGTMSLPAVSALLYLSDSIFGDDDEPFSTEEEIRKLLGDGPLAEYVLKGATAAVGVDLTGSIGYAQIASVMPFQDPDITSRDAFYKTVGALAGPWAGLAGSMADGLGYMQAGDMYKGVELMMPGLVKSSLKAYREQADGMTRRNGDVVLSADDVKALDTFWSALGFRSSTAERVGRLRGMLYKYEQGYKDAAARMKKEYVAALDAGDSRELARIRQDWVKMQQSKVRNGFKPSPIRDLLTAKKTQTKREKTYQDKLERLTPGGL